MSSAVRTRNLDAAALREVFKTQNNQLLRSMYPEIKAAVDSLLENDNVIAEQEVAMDLHLQQLKLLLLSLITPDKKDLGIEFEFDSSMFLDSRLTKRCRSRRKSRSG